MRPFSWFLRWFFAPQQSVSSLHSLHPPSGAVRVDSWRLLSWSAHPPFSSIACSAHCAHFSEQPSHDYNHHIILYGPTITRQSDFPFLYHIPLQFWCHKPTQASFLHILFFKNCNFINVYSQLDIIFNFTAVIKKWWLFVCITNIHHS